MKQFARQSLQLRGVWQGGAAAPPFG